MLTTSQHTQPHTLLQQSSTTNSHRVLSQKALSPQEIERICKAFIRLLHAPLVKEQEKRNNGK